MDKELEAIVQRMIDAGEPEENIALVIKEYKPSTPTEVQTPAPVKKKEGSDLDSVSTSGEEDSFSDGSETINPTPIDEVPDQEVDQPIADLYSQYVKAGDIKPEQQEAIDAEIKRQEEGDRGFWETAIAATEGYLKTGVAVPLFQYDNKEDLVQARELKNRTDFLSALPQETVKELKSYAGNKITDLDKQNMNVLAQNKMMEERGKQLVNELKYHSRAIKELQRQGKPIPPEGADTFRKLHGELEQLTSNYNKNFDLIETNNEDIGGFNDELNLLKRNYSGLDYYKDMARLSGASIISGIGQFAVSTDEFTQEKLGVNLLTLTDDEKKAELNQYFKEFREETARQQELLKPSTSVQDIENMEDFMGWLGEQVAQQLPVITTLVATGGTAGLGILGTGAAGQKIGETEDAREQAKIDLEQLNALVESGDFSEAELETIENQIAEAERVSDITDDEMYLAGLGAGALEVLTERVSLGILAKGKRAFMAAKKSGNFKNAIKGLGQGVIAGGQEGSAEFVNAFGGNLIDFLYLNDPDVHIFDDTLDALASGAALGFGMRVSPSAVGMGAKAFMPKDRTANIVDKSKKVSELLGEIEINSETIDPSTKEMLKKKAAKFSKEIKKEIEKTFGDVSNMEKDDISELIKIDKKSNSITQRMNTLLKSNINKDMKEEFSLDLKADADKLRARKQEIFDKYKTKGKSDPTTQFPKSKVKATVFHGGRAGITKFTKKGDVGHIASEQQTENGIYFSSLQSVAQSYSDNIDGGQVYQAELNIESPYIDTDGTYAGSISDADLKKLKSEGYDGIIIDISKNVKNYVVFESDQINIIDDGTKQKAQQDKGEDGRSGETTEVGEGETKEGTETGVPRDAGRPKIDIIQRKFRVVNPFKTTAPLVEVPVHETIDRGIDFVNQKIVDRFFPVKKIQKSIEAKTGKALEKEANFRQAEVAMHGKAATQMRDFEKTTETLVKDVASSKVDLKQFSDFLMARHAFERNAHIRQLPLKDEGQVVNEAGSGLTDVEAQTILDSFTEEQKKDLGRLADRVDTIIEDTRKIMIDSGLITKEQKDVLTNYYEHYVPLQGYESNDLESDMASAFGLSLSVKGKETLRAAGRTTKADNVLANVIAFRNNMIVRAEKNKVMQTLYNMAKENPDSDVWQLFSKERPDVKKGLTPSGKVGEIIQNMSNLKKYVGVKVKGEQFYIKFANERLAEVINAASVEKTDIMTRTLGKFNRYLSSVLTTYNPEFMISNFGRDIQTAIINQASERDIAGNTLQGKSFIRETIKSTLPAIKAIYNNERGKVSNTEIDRYYREFKEDGAKTDWFYAKSVEEIKKEIQKITDYQTKGGKKNAAKQAFNAIKGFLDDGNTAIENGVRLASYMEARKSGVTREDASEFSKELTINFNQKGEYGTIANTLFLFFNAAVQGTVRFSKAMTTFKKVVEDDGTTTYGLNRAQKVAAALVGASAINTYINMLVSDDDEDGESFYSKIPDYEKERNFIIMNPASDKGEYFKIPLPYGYNVFHNLGTIATEVGTGERGVGDGVGFMVNSLVGAFSPVNLPGSDDASTKFLKTVSPTVLKPAIELATNESHFGSSIYNENLPFGTQRPESHLGRANTNKILTEMAKFLNDATGGSEYVSGWADINPDKVEHLFEFLGGGTAKFLNNVSKTGNYVVKNAKGEEVEIKPREIPLVRKLYGEPSEFANKELYYDRKGKIDQLYEEYKSARKENRGNEKYDGIRTLKLSQKIADKKLKKIRQLLRKYNGIQNPIERSRKIKEAKDKEQAIIDRFNKRYNELRED